MSTNIKDIFDTIETKNQEMESEDKDNPNLLLQNTWCKLKTTQERLKAVATFKEFLTLNYLLLYFIVDTFMFIADYWLSLLSLLFIRVGFSKERSCNSKFINTYLLKMENCKVTAI